MTGSNTLTLAAGSSFASLLPASVAFFGLSSTFGEGCLRCSSVGDSDGDLAGRGKGSLSSLVLPSADVKVAEIEAVDADDFLLLM